MTSLFSIQNNELSPVSRHSLANESSIEKWVEKDPTLIGVDAMIISRQVPTAQRKFIDLLAIEPNGDIVIIELKRDRTPRDVVAQVLDYASWVSDLTADEVDAIAAKYLRRPLAEAFRERFESGLPDINTSHSMMIIASELDPASRRIVEYLSEQYGVPINTAFFNTFATESGKWLTTDFLLDQAEVEERSERKKRAPWSGYYFVNAGIGDRRSWSDMRRYGFIAAGGGEFYSKRLKQLSVGDEIFAYDKGNGYIGYGVVTSESVVASEFMTDDGLLFKQILEKPEIKREGESSDRQEYAVGVDWKTTVEPASAKWFKGAFANQNIVCKLRDTETVDYLLREFGVNGPST